MDHDSSIGISANQTSASKRNSRWLPVSVIAVTLLILAVTILLARYQLRSKVREQIVARDGVVLHAVALMPQYDSPEEAEALEPIQDPANQLTLLLRISRLRGVLGARLFDSQGEFVQAFPPNIRDDVLTGEDRLTLQRLQPVTRFHPSFPLQDLIWNAEDSPSSPAPKSTLAPILEVSIPLHERESETLAGIAQFWIDGQSIALEFERLEGHLNEQAGIAFGVTGILLSAVIGLAFHRLRRTNWLLEQRTNEAMNANRELIQAAKTSAVGAVTSHLIHELKNPLSGLHNIVTAAASGRPLTSEDQWQDAVKATRRMQTAIHEIVTLLREEQSSIHYNLPIEELTDLVMNRLTGPASLKGVRLEREVRVEGSLTNRVANLVVLILTNLGENAIQATPPHFIVSLLVDRWERGWCFSISDHGPGLDPGKSKNLFEPCQSTREGGTGLGLAICKQLANHLGATLVLADNSSSGCRFTLKLPIDAS